MTYTFRHRFRLIPRKVLDVDVIEWVLQAAPNRVVVKSQGGETTLKDADWAILKGEGYESEDHARQAGQQWRSRLERAFAATRVPANFGDRVARSYAFKAALDSMSEAAGGPVVNDEHGLMVFPSDPAPAGFVAVGTPSLIISAPRDRIEAALAAEAADTPMPPGGSIAYDLYSASFNADPDSRLMLLMMAMETLMDQQPRDDTTVSHVERLIECTRDAPIPDFQRQSLLSSLAYLRVESIQQAGRRLAATLGDRIYGGKTPAELFRDCYAMRSKLAHGDVPRPSRSEVGSLAAPLEIMVGDLIAGPALVDVVKA